MTFVHCAQGSGAARCLMLQPFSAQLVFTVLGPLFVMAGAWRCHGSARNVTQGRTWLIVGAIFSAVALYLWWLQAASR